jgi:hypothetical protein
LSSIFIYDDNGQRIEVGRHITPYWNCPWTWRLDVTDYQLLFHGEKKMEIYIETWKDDGFQVTITLELTVGKPAEIPVIIMNLWNGAAVGYGNTGNTHLEKFFIPLTIPIRSTTDKVLLKFAVTGHRFTNNTGQGAEFLRRGRTVKVNSGGNWQNELWQECGSWPVQPQDPGTWYHDRAGWCPGDLIDPWTIDATPQLTPGQDAKIEYIADEYVNTGSAQDATHHVESQLIEMRSTNQIVVFPVSDFLITGYENEALQGKSTVYVVKNFSNASVTWTLQKTAVWLDASSNGGTLASGASVNVTVSCNAIADTLSTGTYIDTLVFTDTRKRKQERIAVTLEKYKRGLVGYWKFDMGTGSTAVDSSGHGYDGTITDPTWVDGKIGKALDFNGSSYVTLPPASVQSLMDEVTICLWQYGDAAAQPSKNSIFESAENGVRILNCHLPWEDTTVYWDAGDNAGNDRIKKKAQADEYEGKWNHWAFTKNTRTGSMKMYLNGALWHSDTSKTRPIGRADVFIIGANKNRSNGYNGMIDEVLLYNYEVPPDKIEDIYNGGSTDISNIPVTDKKTTKFTAIPNPAGCGTPGMRFCYQGESLTDMVLKVFDPVGNCVYKSTVLGLWNLTNSNGRKLASGIYLAVLKGTDNNKNLKIFRTLIGIASCK